MDDSQLQQLHNKQMMLLKLQMQKKKLEQVKIKFSSQNNNSSFTTLFAVVVKSNLIPIAIQLNNLN